jgi:hypothetical protein
LISSIIIVSLKVQVSKELNNLEIINEFLTQAATIHIPAFFLINIDNQSKVGQS